MLNTKQNYGEWSYKSTPGTKARALGYNRDYRWDDDDNIINLKSVRLGVIAEKYVDSHTDGKRSDPRRVTVFFL